MYYIIILFVYFYFSHSFNMFVVDSSRKSGFKAKANNKTTIYSGYKKDVTSLKTAGFFCDAKVLT